MTHITTVEKLVPWLFDELMDSSPQEKVHPGFVLTVGGACYGLIYGGLSGPISGLEGVLGEHWWDDTPTKCGTGLAKFAQALADQAIQHPKQGVDPGQLVELMIRYLPGEGLEVQGEGDDRRVVSTRTFSEARHVRIDVPLGPQD